MTGQNLQMLWIVILSKRQFWHKRITHDTNIQSQSKWAYSCRLSQLMSKHNSTLRTFLISPMAIGFQGTKKWLNLNIEDQRMKTSQEINRLFLYAEEEKRKYADLQNKRANHKFFFFFNRWCIVFWVVNLLNHFVKQIFLHMAIH